MAVLRVGRSKPTKVVSPREKKLHLLTVCKNKGKGTLGQRIKIDTNYLGLNIDNMISHAYQYEVAIEPNTPKRLMQRVFERFREINFPNIFLAFDGNQIVFAPRKLCLSPLEKDIEILDDETINKRQYYVEMREVQNSSIYMASLKK